MFLKYCNIFWAQNLGGAQTDWDGIAPECPPWLRACDRVHFVLVVVVALFMVLVFIYFFQKLPNFVFRFAVWVSGLGLRVRFCFTPFLQSVVQSTAHSSCTNVTLQAADEKFLKNEGPLTDL